MGTETDDTAIQRAARWVLEQVLDIDREAAKADVRGLRSRHPAEDRRALADRIIARTRWKGAAVGGGTGLPTNPWVAVPAAALDVGAMLRLDVGMAARIALLFDESYLDDPEPPYELLVPIFGGRLAAEVAREAAIRGAMGATRQAVRRWISKGALESLKRIALKYLGLKITQRALITKVLPIVGALVGASWNFGEVHVVGNRVYAYFEGKPIE